MEYLLLEADDDGILEEMVNSHIKIGWEPLGGVAVTETLISQDVQWKDNTKTPLARRYTQAMLLRTSQPVT